MERICRGAWHWVNRVGEIVTAVYLVCFFCLWVGGSIHAGHVMGDDEFMKLVDRVFWWLQ